MVTTNFNFKKQWGQNFLRNEVICVEMIEALNLQPKDIVLEIGPGDGQLSQFLAGQPIKLILLEIDPELVELLQERFVGARNVTVLQADILEIDLLQLQKKYHFNKVIGALPYNISKPIINKVIGVVPALIERAVFMIQKEVADSYAKATKKETVLHSYFSQFAEIKILRQVEKSNFFPIPEVTSSIIVFQTNSLNPIWQKLKIEAWLEFLHTVFKEPRKKLLKNLKRNFPYLDFNLILNDLDISIDTRVEQLQTEQILKLFEVISAKIKNPNKTR